MGTTTEISGRITFSGKARNYTLPLAGIASPLFTGRGSTRIARIGEQKSKAPSDTAFPRTERPVAPKARVEGERFDGKSARQRNPCALALESFTFYEPGIRQATGRPTRVNPR